MTILSNVTPDTALTSIHLFIDNPVCDDLDGANPVEKIWIDFDNIIVNPDDNPFRAGSNNLTNQNNLRLSMSEGIHTNEPLPVVEKLKTPFLSNKTGHEKDYICRDGFNRIAALRELGYTGYLFQVVEFDSDATRAKFSARSNRHTPRAVSSEKDMLNMTINLVKKGIISDDYDEMKTWLMENCNTRSDKAEKIVNGVANYNGDGIIIYSRPQTKDLARHLQVEVDGKFDPVRSKLGYVIRSMYEGRTLLKMLRQLRLHGDLSYATFVTRELPKPHQTIDDQRDIMLLKLEEHYQDLLYFVEWAKKNPGKKFWEILGYLPQTKEERKAKNLLPLNKPKKGLDEFMEQFEEEDE